LCGICGKIYFDPNHPVERELLRAMNQQIHHRGPVEDGYHLEANCGLGHKRLSIIDVAGGQQPIYNEDGSCCIIFNGEIYNYRGLRDGLLARGHVFKTHSDTETILHLYEEEGERCVEQLRGMFAFAIWNARTQELLLARDRIGKKPMFYHADGEGLRFASEMKALLPDPAVGRELNPGAVHDFLTLQYVPDPDCIFKGIHKLPPAHTLLVRGGKLSMRRYWELDYEPKTPLSEAEACERIRQEVEEAVRIRLESEVPLGVLLSGGIDSSAVVAFMRRHVAGELRTFSIGFAEKTHNELPFAKIVAEQFATRHEEFIVEPNAIEILPKLVWHFDEPYGDPSGLPTYYVAEITRRQVTVALNGDGGDESFAGYNRYRGLAILDRYRQLPRVLRGGLMAPALGMVRKLAPGLALAERANFLNDMSLMDPAEGYASLLTIFRNDQKAALYTPAFAEQAGARNSMNYMTDAYHRPGLTVAVDRKLNTDVHSYLPGDLLVKMDRMTMAHSLEGRSPFLDHKLMEFAARLPAELKFKNGVQKYILKKALEPILPHEILYRPKAGFGVPLADWFKGQLKDYLREAVESPRAKARGFFKPQAVTQLIEQHISGRQNHYHRLWLLLCLELWCQAYLDRK
jgi:asparagine synthase (glutamine-hydrolysing)